MNAIGLHHLLLNFLAITLRQARQCRLFLSIAILDRRLKQALR